MRFFHFILLLTFLMVMVAIFYLLISGPNRFDHFHATEEWIVERVSVDDLGLNLDDEQQNRFLTSVSRSREHLSNYPVPPLSSPYVNTVSVHLINGDVFNFVFNESGLKFIYPYGVPDSRIFEFHDSLFWTDVLGYKLEAFKSWSRDPLDTP